MSCCCPKEPKAILAMLLRISFGVSLLFIGVSHLMTVGVFKGMVAEGLGPLSSLGTLWAFILPVLQIVGGGLIATGMYMEIGAWAAGIALGSIPVGMLMKPLLSGGQVGLGDAMPAAMNALLWLFLLVFIVKWAVCCKGGVCSTCSGSSCNCPPGECHCGGCR